MKKIIFFLVSALLILVSGCSSPENEGRKSAELLNECNAKFILELDKLKSEFVSKLNVSDFSSRQELKKLYFEARTELIEHLLNETKRAEELAKQKENEYLAEKKNEQYRRYSEALNDNYNREIVAKAVAAQKDESLPANVITALKTINPQRPDLEQIRKDLGNASLTEGKDNGYFKPNWTLSAKDFRVSDLKITETIADDKTNYTVLISARLVSDARSYDVKAKIAYKLPEIDDWKIDFVQSLGVDIVKTHKYDECIKPAETNVVYFRNECDKALQVAVELLFSGGEKRKDNVVVPPHANSSGWYGVYEYKIDWIEPVL